MTAISGTVYGAALNDAAERAALAAAFGAAPYAKPPVAPALYIKSRNCIIASDGTTWIDDDLETVRVAATLGLIFGRDMTRVSAADALDGVAAAAVALDLSEPYDSHYRPVVRQRCRDGFLPVGEAEAFAPAMLGGAIVTWIDGAEAHRWSLDRLARDAAQLIAEVSDFMTLAAGDMLLLGLAGDAPEARAGQRIEAAMAGLAPVAVSLERAS